MKKLMLLLVLFALCTTSLLAQTKTKQIKGKVTDETGVSLPQASVLLSGAKTGVQADSLGNFTIRIPDDGKSHTLVISYVGYSTKTVEVNGASPAMLRISLAKENGTAEEVVVIGYQSVKKKDLTGSVSSVSAKQIRDIPANSSAEALEGRLAGVRVVVNEGKPGSDAEINIRGRNSITQNGSPLYIVDGIQIENALNTISPQDIESVDVLKDASATAIYGARGSNGVVLITTKGGKNTAGRMTVSYNGFVGVSHLAKELDVLKPYDYVLYQWERAKFSGDTSAITRYTRNMNNFDTIKSYQSYPFTDWQQTMMGGNAFQQTHNVSLSGGNAATQYNLSLTANNQDGILLNTGYQRKIVSFRFDHTANDKLKFGFSVRYNQQTVNGAGTSDVGGAGSNNLRQYVRYRPIILPGENDDTFDPNLFAASAGNGLNMINPLQNIYATTVTGNTITYNLNGYINYNIVKGLSFRSTFGYDVYGYVLRNFYDTLTTTSRTFNKQPLFTQTSNNRTTLNNSNVLTYTNPAFLHSQKNNLTVLVGEESYQTVNTDNYLELRYFPIGTTPDIAFANYGLAAAPTGFTQPKVTSDNIPVNNVSFFSRINYSFNRKYLATFTVRADGSSLFGETNKWGYFPSGSVAWRVSEEKFMQSLHFISDMKLRVSYGTAGNNRIPAYSYANAFNVGNGYGLNNSLAYTLTPTSVEGNPNLKWETTTSKNLGLDLSLFNNRVQLIVDAYSNVTKNLLVANAIPASAGYSSQLQNLGSTRNNGLEIQLATSVMRKKDFQWNINYNISFNQNVILSLGNQKQFLYNSGWFAASNPSDYIVKVGEQVGSMYGFVNDGWYKTSDFNTAAYSNASYPLLNTQYTLKTGVPNVYPGVSTILAQPGLPKFKDMNGDGVINASDETIIGHAQPKFIGGLGQQFSYKNFDMSIFVNYSYGNQVYNANKIEFTNAYTNDANLLTLTNGRWHNIDAQGNATQAVIGGSVVAGIAPAAMDALNAGASYWIPTTGQNAYYPMSYAIEDGSFIRINNITIGYSLPKKVLQRAKISSLRFYITGNNLAVITGYSGYDPEANTRRSTPATPGVDYAAYPRSRTFIFGVNLSL